MRLHIPISLRWSDLDAYGHVNNAAMFGLLEEARIHAFWMGEAEQVAERVSADAPATRIFRGGPEADSLIFIARQHAEYAAPIPYLRDPLDLELWVGAVGGASMDVCYEVYSPRGAEPRVLFARALTTIVIVDAVTEKPRRISEHERAVIEAIREDPIVFRSNPSDGH